MYGRQLMDSVHHTAGIKCAEQTTYVNDIDSCFGQCDTYVSCSRP